MRVVPRQTDLRRQTTDDRQTGRAQISTPIVAGMSRFEGLNELGKPKVPGRQLQGSPAWNRLSMPDSCRRGGSPEVLAPVCPKPPVVEQRAGGH